MKIVSIERYKGDTYCVTLENDTKLYMNYSVIYEQGLKSNSEFAETKIADAQYADLKRKASARAMYLLGTKDYCCGEMLKKLTASYGEEIAVEVVEKLKGYGYLDDEVYCRKLANYLIKTKHYGVRKAKYDMLYRGLDRYLVEDALEQFSKDDIHEEILSIIERKYSEKLDDYDETRKVIAALARRGYDYGDVKECIAAYKESCG